jgi:hypothetical protein
MPGNEWNRAAELAAADRLPVPNNLIRKMWVYHHDLEIQSWRYAAAKTDYGREYARIVVTVRNEGEKSAEVAGRVADMDPKVHDAHLAYRLAEQMVTANREALKILHAELDAYRTRAADERAADQFQARTGV